jgi:hypothetical protein
MAFNATKVARAPACFTESKIPMFHRRLKITSDKLGNSSPQLDIDHSMLLYVYYIRCNHIVCIQLYCVIFNYIILYICLYIYIYTLYIDQQSHLVEETRDGNQQNILFLVNQRWYGP